jgi:hypothetical protein
MWQKFCLISGEFGLNCKCGLGLLKVVEGGGGEVFAGGELRSMFPVFRGVGGDEAGFDVGAVAVQQRGTHLALH